LRHKVYFEWVPGSILTTATKPKNKINLQNLTVNENPLPEDKQPTPTLCDESSDITNL
jgi:hypothetical protein